MIGPIEFAPGLNRGSRPEHITDDMRLLTYSVIDLERIPHSPLGFWYPLSAVFPPMLFRVAMVLNALRTLPKPIFLHCRTGVDRTGFIVAKYRVLVQGWSKSAAREEMKAMGAHWWLFWFWKWFI